MISLKKLEKLARKYGTPLFVVDHDQIRANYATFKKYLPRVQAYYAVKANPDPAIVKTLFEAGASFDVASMPEFMIVYENIKNMPVKERQFWIWDKIIYANPIKANETLRKLDKYKALVTYDNAEEIKKIKEYASHSGLVLRIKVPNTGAMVELSSKFGASPGEAVDLILEADKAGLVVEGISFHVGSQTTNFENFVQAINLAAQVYKEAVDRGYTKMNLLDIGGGFPAPYDPSVKPFRELAKKINGGKQMKNLWEINAEKHKTIHPTEKPEKLLERIILIASQEGDTVLDPFMGSGTTGVVAKRLKRNFIGFEIDKNYFNIAKLRIDDTIIINDLFSKRL